MKQSIMTIRERIRFWFDDLSTPMGRATDLVVMALITAACVIAVALTYYDETDPGYQLLLWIDQGITVLFIVEYLLRWSVAENRIRHFFKLYSLIDLIAILPAATVAPQFQVLRIFRLLRVFRLIRFLETRRFFFGTIEQVHLFLLRVGFTLVSIPFVSAGLIFFAEQGSNPDIQTFFDAFYFSVVTLTTVGFGDIVPLTPQGRVITTLMIATGIFFIPWQMKNLIAHFLTVRGKAFFLCPKCGLEYHERDARFCRRCGTPVDPQDRIRL